MKLLIVCVCVLIATENVYSAMTDAQVKSAKKMMRQLCQPKTKVSNAQIDDMHKGTFEDVPELKCYMECVLRTAQIAKDGKINYDSARAQMANLPADLAEVVLNGLEQCKDAMKSGDKCDAALEFYKCFYDSNPEKFFLP